MASDYLFCIIINSVDEPSFQFHYLICFERSKEKLFQCVWGSSIFPLSIENREFGHLYYLNGLGINHRE